MNEKQNNISVIALAVSILVLLPLIPGCELKSVSLVGPFVEIPLYEQESIENLEKAVRRNPDNADAHFEISSVTI